MKPLPLLLAAALVAVAAGALTSALLRATHEDAAPDSGIDRELGALQLELEDVRRELAATARELAELRRSAPLAAGDGRTEVGGVGAAVERWLAENSGAVARMVEAAAKPASAYAAPRAPRATGKGDLTATIERLLDPDLDSLTREELWKELRESGRIDDVILELEEYAERHPDEPDAQVDLAYGYVQKIFEAGNSPMETGMWATKADNAYDAALALDPSHWDARFHKAVGLSFWPPILGKQKQAISQFETLITQQELQAPQSKFAQTYHMLGNMYQQTGEMEKAIATWQKGLALFPDDPKLLAQLALAQEQ